MTERPKKRQFIRRLAARLAGQQVTVYPSYGYQDHAGSGFWTLPIRVWVHDDRDTPFAERAFQRWAANYFEIELRRPLDEGEKSRLERQLSSFISDDKTHESAEIVFAEDPDQQVFHLSKRTDMSGVIEESIKIPESLVQHLTSQSRSWLTIHVRTGDGHGQGEGRVRFLTQKGVSVVSDIDDTVKVTHVPAGKRTVLKNTFLKEFEAAPGMKTLYEGLAAEADSPGDICFHYVSGSPWQLFPALHEFLIQQQGFPRGTFHMKTLRLNLLDAGALKSLRDFVLGGDLATLNQKIRQITNLMIHLPGRKFILVGDSGEKDPEVYRAIQRIFPQQVQRILIRDVHRNRLDGMELLDGGHSALDTSELEEEMAGLVSRAGLMAQESPAL